MQKNKKIKRVASRKIGITWKMFAILIVFLLAVIGVIWFFQVMMLEVFYRNAKFGELDNTADLVVNQASNIEEMEDIVYDSAEDHFSSIIVFEISNEKASYRLGENISQI